MGGGKKEKKQQLMQLTPKEKYIQFLTIIYDTSDFKGGATSIKISEEDFYAGGLSRSDVFAFIEKAMDEGYIQKKPFDFISRNVRPNLAFERHKKPRSKDDIALYNLDINREKIKQYIDEEQPSVNTEKIHFDNGVVTYKNKRHAFHKGKMGRDEPRFALFKILWDKKQVWKKGRIERRGERSQSNYLAVQIGISSDADVFSRNTKIREEFFNLVKGLNRAFRVARIPIKIDRKNGILLIAKE